MANEHGSSAKKQKKHLQDSDPTKRTSPSLARRGASRSSSDALPPMDSHASGRTYPRSAGETGTQRQTQGYWDTVLTSPPSQRGERSAPPAGQTSPNSNENSSRARRGQGSRTGSADRTPPRAVLIAPRGPVVEPEEEEDGCRFECPVEDCHQKFRHRSSRSRHKKKVHSHASHDDR